METENCSRMEMTTFLSKKRKSPANTIKDNHNSLFLEISRLEKQNALYQQKITDLEIENNKKVANMQKKVEDDLKIKYSEAMQEKMKY